MINHRRSELEIIDSILSISKDGARKTEILYQCNLSYKQLREYLSFLLDKNILKEEVLRDNGNSCKVFRPTEKGFVFFKDVRRVLSHFS